MEPHLFLLGRMCSAALASVPVSPKHILTHIVVTIHLTLLVILSLRDGLAFFYSFHKLQVKLRSLYDYLTDRQESTDTQDGGNMELRLGLRQISRRKNRRALISPEVTALQMEQILQVAERRLLANSAQN